MHIFLNRIFGFLGRKRKNIWKERKRERGTVKCTTLSFFKKLDLIFQRRAIILKIVAVRITAKIVTAAKSISFNRTKTKLPWQNCCYVRFNCFPTVFSWQRKKHFCGPRKKAKKPDEEKCTKEKTELKPRRGVSSSMIERASGIPDRLLLFKTASNTVLVELVLFLYFLKKLLRKACTRKKA